MNRLIVVTGGSRGIGRAIVERFAVAGFDAAVCGRKKEDLDLLRRDISGKYGVEVMTFVADLAEKMQVNSFSAWLDALNRPVEVLVNNAGFFRPGKVMEEPDGSLEQTIGTNLYSAYYMTRGVMGGMKSRKAGHIFNLCSIASIKAYPNGGSYAISKFALLGFSKVLREEVKELGIRVTAILPGATKTESWAGTDLPDSRFIKPEDVAEAVYAAYSLSDRSVVEEMIIRPQLGDI